MSNELFNSGGPHRIRKTGPHTHQFSIRLPADSDGRVARACPEPSCSPGEFKVTPGTGITEQQESAFCPYCRKDAAPSDFNTKEQIRYAKYIVAAEAHQGIQKALGKALGLNSRGHRSLAKGGLFDVSLEMKPVRKPHVRRPYANVLRRDVVCPSCGLDQSVYGLATWCSDCGKDIFTTHVYGEIGIIEKALGDVPRREKEMGERIAARDIENALEDLVSIYEAVLKREIRAHLTEKGIADGEIQKRMRKIGSRLQSVRKAQEIVPEVCGVTFDFFDVKCLNKLDLLFQKRHPITHNLGVIDRAYLDRIKSVEREGREVRVSFREVEASCRDVFNFLEDFHFQLYPHAVRAQRRQREQNPNS